MQINSPLQLAICKMIASKRSKISEEELLQFDIVSLSDMLLDCIWPRHEFGDWSKRWIWLDGPVGTIAIKEFDDDSLAVTGLWSARGNSKIGSTVPIRLELKKEHKELSYKLYVDRIGNDQEIFDSRNGEIVYALGIGSFSGEWNWKHEAAGYFELAR